jgi:hypothetical protein
MKSFKREGFVQKKIQFLYNSLTLNDLNAVYPVNKYLNTISNSITAQKETLITGMLKQMDVLETEYGVKDSYLDMILKDLLVLALNLIEYINNELINNNVKNEKKTKIYQIYFQFLKTNQKIIF